jgi:ArsR family transcriptional regulator
MDAALHAIDRVCKALADPTRLRILGLLLGGEVCVCHIHESLRIPQPRASRHLAYLRRAGLVETRKDGQWVHYRLASPKDDVTRTLMETIGGCVAALPTWKRDVARLEQRTGCCITPSAAGLRGVVTAGPAKRGRVYLERS